MWMRTPFPLSFARSLLLGIVLAATGCAHKRPVEVWRFNHCVKNVDHWVCECSRYHIVLNQRGQEVRVCD